MKSKLAVLAINLGNFGSTGNIARSIGKTFETIFDGSYYFAYPWAANNTNSLEKDVLICGRFIRKVNNYAGFYTGFLNCFSIFTTLNLLKKISNINPKIIHLHNLHNNYINLPLLFHYIKRHAIPVVWTLHVCWAFTGQCLYFTMVKCDKWINGCHDCPSIHGYPSSRVDRTRIMWKWKKNWFSGVQSMILVTPSQWLARLVKQSYLKDYPVRVINNGIDLTIFTPTYRDFRERHNLHNKFILLGVSFDWGKRKGLDVFIELSKRLDSSYQIVLVGTDDNIDVQLPDNIISVHRTQNQRELAEMYTAADIFVNPTREEVFGLVNVESLACGTPVVTFRSGGSPECIDEICGSVVDCDDINAMEHEIIRICEARPYSEESCLKRAAIFNMDDRLAEYVELYKSITEGQNEGEYEGNDSH